MKNGRIDIRTLRREQIVAAAMSIIADQGIQNLSLSAIEKKAGMSRGQLTYYFKTKEEILLAVFDRVVQRMHESVSATQEQMRCRPGKQDAWTLIRLLLQRILTQPPLNPEFGSLQYTFLAEMGHREDFRQRLASLYDLWRTHMAADLERDLAGVADAPRASGRAMASLVQALFHGLAMQRAVDPLAFEGEEMLALCLDLLSNFLHLKGPSELQSRQRTARKPARRRSERSPRHPLESSGTSES